MPDLTKNLRKHIDTACGDDPDWALIRRACKRLEALEFLLGWAFKNERMIGRAHNPQRGDYSWIGIGPEGDVHSYERVGETPESLADIVHPGWDRGSR